MPRHRSLTILLIVTIAAAASAAHSRPVVQAEEQDGHLWFAYSTNAMGITGDIVTTANRIHFENGSILRLEATGKSGVFGVPAGFNPVLRNENRLCGSGPPTHATLYVEDDILALAVYRRRTEPRSPENLRDLEPGICASYKYMSSDDHLMRQLLRW